MPAAAAAAYYMDFCRPFVLPPLVNNCCDVSSRWIRRDCTDDYDDVIDDGSRWNRLFVCGTILVIVSQEHCGSSAAVTWPTSAPSDAVERQRMNKSARIRMPMEIARAENSETQHHWSQVGQKFEVECIQEAQVVALHMKHGGCCISESKSTWMQHRA
jgi:hypothetical protein